MSPGEVPHANVFGASVPTTVVVGADSEAWCEQLAEGLVRSGESARILQIRARDGLLSPSPRRIAERFRSELGQGPRTTQLLVSSPSRHALAVVEGLLQLQLAGIARLDGLVCVVDGPTASVRLLTDQSVVPVEEVGALAIADHVVLSRAELLTPDGVDAVAWALRNENRLAQIRFPAVAGTELGALTDMGAWNGALALGPSRAEDGTFSSAWKIEIPTLQSFAAAIELVRCLFSGCWAHLFRVQGLIPVLGGTAVQVVGAGSTCLTLNTESGLTSGQLCVVAKKSRAEEISELLSEAIGTHGANSPATGTPQGTVELPISRHSTPDAIETAQRSDGDRF